MTVAAIIDIGKTNAKVALVDLDRLAEIAVRRTPNDVIADGPYPHYDEARLWSFILDSLTELGREAKIDAISTTTHGASAALLDAEGKLALPILDYEFDGPEATRARYDVVRPPFAETGTPRLPNGLNLGAQLYWQQEAFPAEFARVTSIVTYPQYWGFRLTGVAANEATSLGCHTDLWSPARRGYSSLVRKLGWGMLFAPVVSAAHRLGPILPEIASRTGLDPATPVHAGIHDSNASLLPHLMARRAPFSVVSTGTWVIVLAVGALPVTLDPDRDTLINVNALGDPVPSARFMGGRERSLLTDSLPAGTSDDDLAEVLANKQLLLPQVVVGSGPFPDRFSAWLPGPPQSPGTIRVATSFYEAMMTAVCLDLVGAQGNIIVEGPFGQDEPYLGMLSAATGRTVLASSGVATGTSTGAALLTRGGETPVLHDRAVASPGPGWTDYAATWRAAVAGR
jgi:sugar (pentulose or hexulose) kinase